MATTYTEYAEFNYVHAATGGAGNAQPRLFASGSSESAPKLYLSASAAGIVDLAGANSLAFAGDSGSDTGFKLDSDTLTFAGTANEITTAVSDNTVTISLPDSVTIGDALTVTGVLTANGNVDLGNATSDTVSVTGRFDTDLLPSSDSARDLGSSALQWAEVHADAGHIDALTVTGTSTLTTVDINGGAIDGTAIGASSVAAGSFAAIVGTTATLSSTLTANGDVDLGNATSDTVTVTGRFDSDLVPSSDSARDLGSSDLQWAELHVDAGHIDTLGSALDANAQNITNVGTFEVDGGATFNGTMQVGNANTDVLTLTSQLTASTSALFSETVKFNSKLLPVTDDTSDLGAAGKQWKDLYIDGVAYIDSLQADALGAALDANNQAITNINVDSGAIDGTPIGANSAAAGTFAALVGTSLNCSDGNITNVGDIAVDTISADDGSSFAMGSNWTNASRTVADMGTVTTMDLNGGSIDGATLGAASAVTITNADMNGGSIDGVAIGAASRAAGSFTTLAANGDMTMGDTRADVMTCAAQMTASAGATFGTVVYGTEFSGSGNGLFGGILKVATKILPDDDDLVDLGASSKQFKDLYLDGVAYIDSLQADQLGAALDANSQAITNINVDSGAIDGTVIGANSAAAGTFAAVVATSLNCSEGSITNVNDIALDTISADDGSSFAMGSNWTNAGRTVADGGTLTTVDINGGSIDGATLGGASAVTITDADMNGGSIDGVVIGAASAAAGSFTTLICSSMGANWTNASRTVADMGVVTTMDLNGGTVDGATIGASSPSTGVFTTLTCNSSFLPDAAGGADLGSVSAEWGDLYIADDKKIQLGNGQDFTIEYDEDGDDVAQFAGANMRLGHGAATELQFRDSALKIYSSANGQLDVAADAELQLEAPIVDINASTSVRVSTKMCIGSDALSFGSNELLVLPSTGKIKAAAYVTYSDESLKTNIETLDSALETVKSLRGVSYEVKETGNNEIGLIAQEVNEIVPSVVQDGSEVMGIDYSRLTAVLIEAVKELAAKVENTK
jgi:hypothetical protein